jgi:hypothetical protein
MTSMRICFKNEAFRTSTERWTVITTDITDLTSHSWCWSTASCAIYIPEAVSIPTVTLAAVCRTRHKGNWLTPRSRVLGKLIVVQLVKKCPAFHATRRFITVFTRLRRHGLHDRGSIPGRGVCLSHLHRVQIGPGTQSASSRKCTGGSFPVVKRPGRDAEHSHPSSVEVKNAWSRTSTPRYVFMAWCLVKHKDNNFRVQKSNPRPLK